MDIKQIKKYTEIKEDGQEWILWSIVERELGE